LLIERALNQQCVVSGKSIIQLKNSIEMKLNENGKYFYEVSNYQRSLSLSLISDKISPPKVVDILLGVVSNLCIVYGD
jgi:hypothetical protein